MGFNFLSPEGHLSVKYSAVGHERYLCWRHLAQLHFLYSSHFQGFQYQGVSPGRKGGAFHDTSSLQLQGDGTWAISASCATNNPKHRHEACFNPTHWAMFLNLHLYLSSLHTPVLILIKCPTFALPCAQTTGRYHLVRLLRADAGRTCNAPSPC